jgi:hypothetical protein
MRDEVSSSTPLFGETNSPILALNLAITDILSLGLSARSDLSDRGVLSRPTFVDSLSTLSARPWRATAMETLSLEEDDGQVPEVLVA